MIFEALASDSVANRYLCHPYALYPYPTPNLWYTFLPELYMKFLRKVFSEDETVPSGGFANTLEVLAVVTNPTVQSDKGLLSLLNGTSL